MTRSAPQPEQESILGHFLLGGLDLEMLDRLLRATFKKRSSTFLTKKCTLAKSWLRLCWMVSPGAVRAPPLPLVTPLSLLSTACRPVRRSHPHSRRVDTVLNWLSGSVDGKFPDFVSVYFSVVDTAGHQSGHQSPEVRYSGPGLQRPIGL